MKCCSFFRRLLQTSQLNLMKSSSMQFSGESILAQPLWRNPRLEKGLATPKEVVAAFTARGITHLRDLQSFFTITAAPRGKVRLKLTS